MDYEAYQRFSRLVRIVISGCDVLVPENNTLLRGFQYLEPEKLPLGPWCWNGDCGADRIRWRRAGEAETRIGLACQICAEEGIEISEMTPELRRALRPVLEAKLAPAGSE